MRKAETYKQIWIYNKQIFPKIFPDFFENCKRTIVPITGIKNSPLVTDKSNLVEEKKTWAIWTIGVLTNKSSGMK